MTVQELITGSLRMIGELSPGQTPNASELSAGMEMLNAILESWELQRRKVFVIDELQFPLTSGKGTYTMGEGGEFDSYRPVKIQSANIIYSETSDPLDGVSHPLQLVNSKDFAAIPDKGMTALRPVKLYNDNDYPLLNLNLWPIPEFPAT
jgi:hypothetical protein